MKRTTFAGTLLVLAIATGARANDVPLKPGDPAPDFNLMGSDGKTYHLKDFAGKKAVVLAWFPRAFTPGCTAECRSLRDNGLAIRQFKVAYFTVSTDTAEKNQQFAEQLHLDYPILSDPERQVGQAYGVVHKGHEGAERCTFYIGTDGKIQRIDHHIDPERAGEDIATTLAKLNTPGKTSPPRSRN